MERTTFIFKSDKSYRRVWSALNDTFYVFASHEHKKITVWGAAAIENVRNSLNECGIKYEEI